MSTETDLRDTLRSAERLAPDPAPVADRIAAGIRARRRHRTAGAAAAAVALATAAAVAVPSVLLSGPDGAAPAPVTPATAPVSPGTAPPTPVKSTPIPAGTVRFDPLAVPFTVGFLPPGWHPDGALQTERGLALRRYDGPQPADELAVQVWDTRLSGRPAGEASPFGPVVRRQLSGDVWASVAGRVPTAVLRRVLSSVVPGDAERLTFPFRLGWLPAGYRVNASSSGAHRWIGTGSGGVRRAEPPLLDAGLQLDRGPGDQTNLTGLAIGVSTEDGTWQDKGVQANGTLLGRPSRYTEDLDVAQLHVFDLEGMHVLVTGSIKDRPELDRAALERIVRELRMVDDPDRPAGWTDRPLP